MSRWIDADALHEYICSSINEMTKIGVMVDGEYLWGLINEGIENAPTISLVRCAECKYCMTDIVVQRREDGYERAINLCRCPKHKEEWSVDKDWYCADAERKENE